MFRIWYTRREQNWKEACDIRGFEWFLQFGELDKICRHIHSLHVLTVWPSYQCNKCLCVTHNMNELLSSQTEILFRGARQFLYLELQRKNNLYFDTNKLWHKLIKTQNLQSFCYDEVVKMFTWKRSNSCLLVWDFGCSVCSAGERAGRWCAVHQQIKLTFDLIDIKTFLSYISSLFLPS